MRGRLSLMMVMCGLAALLVACGRASPADIDAALGITPTPTLSAEQIATGTAEALADQQTRTAAQAQLGSPGSGGPVELAAAGNPALGRTQYLLRCQQCHAPGGAGRAPALAGPDNPATALSDQQLFDLVRTGTGHPAPPGPYSTVDITDKQLIDVIAFIRQQSQ
jgi:mono/diheme cytochrome c family protein